jgi:hypothetical protein
MRPFVRPHTLALLVTALPWIAVRAGAQASTQPPSVAESRRTGTVSGRVVDRVSQRPIADVQVTITDTDLEARSDADGGFTLRGVPAGTHRVRAVRVGYRPGLAPDVSVSAGYQAQVRFELQRIETTLAAVRVRSDDAALAPPPDAPVTTITLTADLVRRAPGALADVSRLVQSLPGVAAGNDQRNDIIARGGAPSENLFLIDGFEVPGINHFGAQGTSGGGIGMFHNELLAQATFHAGAFPSQYGNRLSAVLDLRQRDGDRERWRTQADMSLAGVGLIVEGPIGRRASVIASAREGYFGLLAGPFGLTAVPRTTNGQFRASWEPGAGHRVWLSAIAGRDAIDFESLATDLENLDPTGSEVVRGDRHMAGLGWQHPLGLRGVGRVTVSRSGLGYGEDVNEARLGGARTWFNRSRESEVTAKYDLTMQVPGLGELNAGAVRRRLATRTRMEAPFGSFLPLAPSGRVNPFASDATTRADVDGVHLQLSRAVGPAQVTAGVRADRFGLSETVRVGPRVTAAFRVAPTLELTGGAGRYHQQVPLVYVAALPANRTLPPMRADHAVVGLAWTPAPELRVTLEAYEKRYADYPVSTDLPQFTLANAGDSYDVVGALVPLTSRGVGRVRGLELFAQRQLVQGTYWQAAFSTTRSRQAALDGVLRRGAYDAPFSATVIAGRRVRERWDLSTRASWAAGRPMTPVRTDLSTAQKRLVLDATRLNEERSADYLRVDVRAERRVALGGRTLAVYLDVQNVTNRRNVAGFDWNSKTNRLAFTEQAGLLPVLGLNLKF